MRTMLTMKMSVKTIMPHLNLVADQSVKIQDQIETMIRSVITAQADQTLTMKRKLTKSLRRRRSERHIK